MGIDKLHLPQGDRNVKAMSLKDGYTISFSFFFLAKHLHLGVGKCPHPGKRSVQVKLEKVLQRFGIQ